MSFVNRQTLARLMLVMTHYLLRTIVLMLTITGSLKLHAQGDSYQFETIDSRRGLSHNQVNSIIKDEKGFIWFGTVSGLNRYDGYSIKVFKHRIGDTTSMSDDYVSQVVKGPDHNLWVLTPNGWNIFDPRTEKFTPHPQRFIKSIGIEDEGFSDIVQDNANNFWFVYPRRGLYKYNSVSRKISVYTGTPGTHPLFSPNVSRVAVDHAGFLWVIYTEGILEKIDPKADKVIFRTAILRNYLNTPDVYYRLFIDSDNDLWVYTRSEAKGVFCYRPSQNSLLRIEKESGAVRLNNNIVNAVTQDSKGLIWVATDHGGINIINKKDFSVRYLTNNENDPKSLSQNSINTLYTDSSGIVWIGTYKKGVNQYHESNAKFPLLQHLAGNSRSLPYNDVNKFIEDKWGNLWIGTNGGGLIYFDRKAGTYKQYLHSNSDPNSLTNNVIVSMLMDSEQRLWIGTYYGGMDCFDGKKFIHYRHNDKNETSLADDRVWEIFQDSRKRFWVGTLSEGLELFDPGKGTFTHYKYGRTNRTPWSRYICSIVEDRQGNIWMATSLGLDVLDVRSGLFNHYEHIESDTSSLSYNNVIELLPDSRGLLWIATRDGLNIYDPAKKTFRTFRTANGLPDNSIVTIMEDDNHNMWITTPNGVSNIIVSGPVTNPSFQFKNYNESDGLQDGQFNENAALKLRTGELVVGGANGFNIFLPSKPAEQKPIPDLVLTDFQIFNNSVKIGEEYNGRVVLPVAISEAKDITLKYNQNVFTIEFAAIDFLSQDKIKYAYKLQGFSNEWLTTDAKNRKATFTNLNPGTYTLLIKAGNGDGVWSVTPYALTIHILPPFYLTPYAFFIYLLLIVAALLLGRKIILRRARAKFSIEQERQEAQRLHELDMMKIKFFTNISHEFRTPLSLIISPVEKLIKKTEEPAGKKQFQLIHRNARRLLNLVNQLMDFRKMEEQELRLNKTSGDIISFVKDISYSFSDLAENKNIRFSVQSSEDFIFTTFDHDKLERILFNLLSNAFKFTPVGGTVMVLAETIAAPGEKMLLLKVSDSGIGIARDKLEKIFERFFQNEIPGTMVNQGSGIGLAITKEFVRMHGGVIDVQSEVNKGSCFAITLPLTPIEIENANVDLPEAEEATENEPVYRPVPNAAVERNGKGKKKTILLVEDNDDFRFYIKDNLKAYYTIVEAENGKLGWQKALAHHPDLIVCDISMPEMNGIELCQKLKEDSRTSVIPVILLTALTGEEQQLAGLQTGASDYMTKPFNFEILLSKIHNLLLQQESFKKTYQKQVQAQPSELPITQSAEEKFLQQVLTVIETNMSNPEFSVDQLSRDVFMSRVALYKKLFALSGKTPIEFIRSVRLQRAAQLLQKKELTVAEVAYEVGFNNPKYFSRYFKEAYNILPSAYGNQEHNEQK